MIYKKTKKVSAGDVTEENTEEYFFDDFDEFRQFFFISKIAGSKDQEEFNENMRLIQRIVGWEEGHD